MDLEDIISLRISFELYVEGQQPLVLGSQKSQTQII